VSSDGGSAVAQGLVVRPLTHRTQSNGKAVGCPWLWREHGKPPAKLAVEMVVVVASVFRPEGYIE